MLIGACITLQNENEIMSLAFGVVSLVAMTPLITIQLLGFKSVVTHNVKKHHQMKQIVNSEDRKIINFR